MTPKKELRVAYGLIIILFLVGVISYAAFPAKTPDQPVRIIYKGIAGKVLFDHKTHASESGYGLSCNDCHHHPKDEKTSLRACGDCHQALAEGQKFPESCTECHEADEIEDTEIITKTDAFHSQCEECHRESGAGPEENRCNWCHVS
jgi:hypothetical protein